MGERWNGPTPVESPDTTLNLRNFGPEDHATVRLFVALYIARIAPRILHTQAVSQHVVETAVLLTEEAYTNADRRDNGRSATELRIGELAGILYIAIGDTSPEFSSMRTDGRNSDTEGRGLILVDALAVNYGEVAVDADDTQKVFWFGLNIAASI
jgi:hypothetical protein